MVIFDLLSSEFSYLMIEIDLVEQMGSVIGGYSNNTRQEGDAASTRPAATRYYSGVCAGHPDDGFPAHDRRREEPEGGVL